MTWHVLTGDALLASFPKGKLDGSLVIIRECLIEGPVNADSSSNLFEKRKAYLNHTYPESNIDYEDDVVFEFEKLKAISEDDEVNFWFEHDLFCQTNFWFTLTLLPRKNLKLFRVSPIAHDTRYLWRGFGPMNAKELLTCFKHRTKISDGDIELGRNLWDAYSSNDMNKLASLSTSNSTCFSYLKEVCEAQIARISKDGQPGRPERILKRIIEDGNHTFEAAFDVFSELEGIYGFGDLQVKKIYDHLIS